MCKKTGAITIIEDYDYKYMNRQKELLTLLPSWLIMIVWIPISGLWILSLLWGFN